MSYRQTLSEWLYWIAALILGVLPAALATDFGGVLPWTQYVSALGILVAGLIAATGRLASVGCPGEVRLQPKAFLFTALLAILLAGAALQTVAMPRNWVLWLSPASYAAHVDWAGALVGVPLDEGIPISIAPFDSRHSIAYLSIAVLVSFVSVWLFQHRGRTTWLLSAIAIGACSVALIGLARKLAPGFQLWSFRSGGEGAPFGTFMNRNNAALALNLGIAAALGLVVWRKMALATSRWFRDVPTLALSASICVCLVGLIGCGSRGGLLSTLVAGGVTVFTLRGRLGRFAWSVMVIVAIAVLVLAVLRTEMLGNQGLRDDTLEQIKSTVGPDAGDRLSTDTRLAHWPDGFRTAIKHFPAGSGLASYGYAYLPWQITSPWRLCQHADNLWLEMFVELGLGGFVLAIVCIVLVSRSLGRLRRSPDPINQGLAVTGCYAAITIAVSQVFDYGLIVPANLIAVVTIMPVIISRASSVIESAKKSIGSRPTDGIAPKLVLLPADQAWWKSPLFMNERLLQSISFVGLALVAVVSVDRLRVDSAVDYFVRTAEPRMQDLRTDEVGLGKWVDQMRLLADNHAHPDLLDILVEAEFQRGRLLELRLMNAGRLTEDQQTKWYRATSRSRRRLGWRAADPTLFARVTQSGRPVDPFPLNDQLRQEESPYVRALRWSEASITRRPLALQPRINQVFLEFIHQSPDRTLTAINQSATLFRNTPELQLRLGALAADQGDYDTATKIWRRAAELDERMVNRVLGRAIRFPDFPVREVIPNSVDRKKQADQFLQSLN